MTKIPLIITIFSFFEIFSQSNKIDTVIFEHRNSTYIQKNSNVKLFMSKEAGVNYVEVFCNTDNKEFKTQLSLKKYDEICGKLIDLKPIDIINNAPMYLDASDTEISFTIYNNSVSYKVSGLNKGDKITNRKDFLEVTLMILEAFEIQIHGIN